jgi:hypothetical protein
VYVGVEGNSDSHNVRDSITGYRHLYYETEIVSIHMLVELNYNRIPSTPQFFGFNFSMDRIKPRISVSAFIEVLYLVNVLWPN